MKIQISGNNIDITPALKTFIQDKAAKLERHAQQITSLAVTLLVQKDQQIADASLTANDFNCHAHADSPDMYHSIDQMIDKLDRQLVKHKEKQHDHRD